MAQCTRCQADVAPSAERCPHCGAWLSPATEAEAADLGDWQAEVRALLQRGDKIAAIKLYRQATGVGLAEAKAAVESGTFVTRPAASREPVDAFERELLDLLAQGNKIAAIKRYRERNEVDLRDAKEAVEKLAARHGVSATQRGCFGAVAVLLTVMLLAALAFAQ